MGETNGSVANRTSEAMDLKVLFVCLFGIFAAYAQADLEFHKVYARDAVPYGGYSVDETLPYVPRYRYPVKSYLGKRMGTKSQQRAWNRFLEFLLRDGNAL